MEEPGGIWLNGGIWWTTNSWWNWLNGGIWWNLLNGRIWLNFHRMVPSGGIWPMMESGGIKVTERFHQVPPFRWNLPPNSNSVNWLNSTIWFHQIPLEFHQFHHSVWFHQIPPSSTKTKFHLSVTEFHQVHHSVTLDSTKFHHSGIPPKFVDSTKFCQFHRIPPFSHLRFHQIPPKVPQIFSIRFHHSVNSTRFHHSVNSTRFHHSVKFHQIPPFSQVPPDSTIQSSSTRFHHSVKFHQIRPFCQIPPGSTIQSNIPLDSTIRSFFRNSTRFHHSVDSTRFHHSVDSTKICGIPPNSTFQSP